MLNYRCNRVQCVNVFVTLARMKDLVAFCVCVSVTENALRLGWYVGSGRTAESGHFASVTCSVCSSQISQNSLPPLSVLSSTLLTVPAQPSSFEAEAELDTRIMLTWLWPVQDPIIKYELQYWEDGSDNKVRITT